MSERWPIDLFINIEKCSKMSMHDKSLQKFVLLRNYQSVHFTTGSSTAALCREFLYELKLFPRNVAGWCNERCCQVGGGSNVVHMCAEPALLAECCGIPNENRYRTGKSRNKRSE